MFIWMLVFTRNTIVFRYIFLKFNTILIHKKILYGCFVLLELFQTYNVELLCHSNVFF